MNPKQNPSALTLPHGFSGSVDLRDRCGGSIGRLLLSKLGLPDSQIRSRDLDVRWIASGELLIDRATQPVRCYLQMPKELQAASLICEDALTRTSTTHAMPPAAGSSRPNGISLSLPGGFSGKLDIRNAANSSVVLVRVDRAGRQSEVTAPRVPPGFELAVRTNASLLDIRVQALHGRTRIR